MCVFFACSPWIPIEHLKIRLARFDQRPLSVVSLREAHNSSCSGGGWGATYRPRKKAEDKRSLLPHREKRSQIWRIMDHPSRCFTWNSRSFFSLFCWTNMERKKYTTNFGRRQQTQQRLCPLPKSAEGTQRIRLPLTKWSLGRHPFQARLILRDEAWRRNFHFHLLRAVFAVVDSIQLKRGMNKGLGFFQWFWQRVSYNNIIHIL